MESAPETITPITVDIEGMDEFFGQTDGQMMANCDPGLAVGGQRVATISEASRLLQIPYSSLRRQIKLGKFKTQTGTDGKLRVVLDSNADPMASQTVATTFQAATSSGQIIANPDLSKLLELVERQSKELQAASCRIGWLESQLQERQKGVKLLTDNERKPRWWQRGWSWFKREQQ